MRLDHYLVGRLPGDVSRAMIQRGIKAGMVLVNERQENANYKLRKGETVSVRFGSQTAPPKEVRLRPQPIPLEIVYEDETVLVVNKPPGLVTHPAPGHWDGTLVNAILWHLEQGSRAQPEQGGVPPRAGIVHRLDKDTSGLLLVAKTESAHQLLSRQLKVRHIHRNYLAVVEGHLPLDAGTVVVPIGRHLVHRKLMTVRHLGGRTAVTHYRVLKRGLAQDFKPEIHPKPITQPSKSITGLRSDHASAFAYTILHLALETGRTHQIRVHMAHVGHPIFGDTTYGQHPGSFWSSVGIARQLLHAYHLIFQHPVEHRTISVVAPVPEDMRPWIGDAATSLFG